VAAAALVAGQLGALVGLDVGPQPLAGRALLAGDVQDGAVIRVNAAGDQITVGYENPG